ncbi:dihydrolipoamide acetyltransferase family protein [Staphylococcus massiliensis]|uniref:Dihydrolipoamide acetyltransferase component of pyruvate dehydrogenase complex n=1 Tax=Staphylococcus massiliensis S46 TaxID=1229783 RepID=K9ARE9_9STAP|nr:dihydrolipoamide acetyltransferase family protein [Staphylococcus massiliensis]EKU49844.1 branched-chain alpha-keto aciddehydrogenase complex lipoamide acyltransferase subunit [Staphylococcus massiliensis S46]MCG3398948.1 2-oxo acid dehydrogenase subunit E2 [Staphylococcus massiliensis]MCG3401050.1 2-oxo acid dehydrogenase subunit E2 [Staphylococcus massiliensis]POA02064.1 2-oxo acid dehydrogenase subunit E2 [Staphylococcus massiliensis CCUG 55927]
MEIKMPKLGESVHEGTIEQWLVKEGDTVEEYDPLCEVITDKVTAEVPSSYAGTITEIIAIEGETIEVGTVICKMVVEGDDSADNEPTSDAEDAQSESPSQDTSSSEKPNKDNQAQTSKPASNQPKNNGRYSPVVFRLASEHNINLADVEGTGNLGRVTKKDIERVIQEGPSTAIDQTSAEPSSQAPQSTPTTASSDDHANASSIPVDGVRRQIANKMVQSVTEIPHAWMKVEVDATELVKTRNHYKKDFKKNEGYNLTFFAFFVKAVAEALKQFPMLNSSWQGSEIKVHKDINISIAVASENKLFVPVIKHADEKSIKGIAREIDSLAHKARNNQLTQADMEGGTFTVNNTGSFGSVSSMGIINHPQAAILQVESIIKRPMVINDMIGIRDMVNLCISIDHRILDGLMAGQFINYVKDRIESYTIEHTQIF